jgi:hypothetical protein
MQDEVRLINANALSENILALTGMFTDEMGFVVSSNAVQAAIEFEPTIDAVPVVRCAQCKDYELDCGYCDYWEVGRNVDDYCSRGARR